MIHVFSLEGDTVHVPRRLLFRVVCVGQDPDGHPLIRLDVDDVTLLPSLDPDRLYAADIMPVS